LAENSRENGGGKTGEKSENAEKRRERLLLVEGKREDWAKIEEKVGIFRGGYPLLSSDNIYFCTLKKGQERLGWRGFGGVWNGLHKPEL